MDVLRIMMKGKSFINLKNEKINEKSKDVKK